MCKYYLKYLVIREDKFFVHKKQKRKQMIKGYRENRGCGLKDKMKEE
jgi:hypothetical protein